MAAHRPQNEHVERQRKRLPDDPGVYIYSDADGNVLYVGKARNLKKRVNTYFSKSHDAKTHALVMRIANIEVLALSTEQEALIVEQNLVKRHRPPFNVMLRDDKSYPYIAITLKDDYPRVLFTREKHKTGTRYFGPYSNAKRVRITLDLLNRIFPYRPCEGPQPGRQSGVPCLDYHIERCAAPCVGYISKEDYARVIEQVMSVLNGKSRPVEKELERQMQEASAALEFEKAARLRNRIRGLKQVVELQAVDRPGHGSFDVIGAATHERRRGGGESDPTGGELHASANVQVLQVRDGRLTDRRSLFLDNVDGLSLSTVLTQFALSYYQPGRPIPPLVAVPPGAFEDADCALLAEELTLARGAQVEVRSAQRGDKRRLAELAARNAEHALRYDSIRERARIEKRAAALEELRDELDLDSLPLRIECYDISNLQEQAPVASMVVFEDGRPRKEHYRKFAMRHAGGQDDFAMMHEVITRRFRRLATDQQIDGPELAPEFEEELDGDEAEAADEQLLGVTVSDNGEAHTPLEEAVALATAAEQAVEHATGDVDVAVVEVEVEPEEVASEATGDEAAAATVWEPDDDADPSFSSFPSLVIIDGGKGQLNAAVAALRELGIERVSVCSLAKREEEVFLPGQSSPIALDKNSAASHLLQRVRNEAHRFALGYHRTKRSMDRYASVLDMLEGIGPVRRRALLNFFGSPEKVMAASLDELESVPGLPGKVARRVHEELNRLGGGGGVVRGGVHAEPTRGAHSDPARGAHATRPVDAGDGNTPTRADAQTGE